MTNGIPVCIVNVRGLKVKLRTVDRLAEEVAVLSNCQTWLREKDKDVKQSFDGSTEVPPLENTYRGSRGWDLSSNPFSRTP